MYEYGKRIVLAVSGGMIFTVPFLILEWINTPGFWAMGIPPLFYAMWFSGSVFSFAAGSVFRKIRNQPKTIPEYVSLMVNVIVAILPAWIFTGLVIDQWPCFMGIPNCD